MKVCLICLNMCMPLYCRRMSDNEDIPDMQTCQQRVEQFAEITGTDEACAQFYLQDRQWSLEVGFQWLHDNIFLVLFSLAFNFYYVCRGQLMHSLRPN